MIEAQIRDIAKISEKQFSSSNENSGITRIQLR
jgi:hypothetical protein